MAKPWKIQARQSAKDKLWYVNLSGGNGETIMRSKGHPQQAAAEKLCADVQAASIEIVLDTKAVPLALWFVQPQKSEKDKLWYNKLIGIDGEKMWSEGYARIDSAQRACAKMRDALVVTLPAEPLK